MFHVFNNPSWIDSRLLAQRTIDEIPQALFDEINSRLSRLTDEDPLVSIVIPVLNEEVSILRTLHSLSCNRTRYPIEIIVVNNGSTDRTQEVLDRLNLRTFFQAKPGWGPARQMGQEQARGRYILMADADCFYPPLWIEKMTGELLKEGVTCVYGGYSFLAVDGKPRWKFFIYEFLRNMIAEVRRLKRPWYNSLGMCMGYVRELGLKKGFIDKKIRGEDGRMCFELAQLGRIVRVRSSDVIVWTFPRTLQKDGSLVYAILNRALVEFSRLPLYFNKQPVHDTHTSPNTRLPSFRYFTRRTKASQEKPVDTTSPDNPIP
jgi:cellulose synthase/poly-beta-1,6-N-acetylglucosamine synthase-like glycosyltransferase